MSKVTTPTYIVATREDHIAPWRSCYPGVHAFAGPTRFVLGASGHIAGIVNPPAADKYGYWTNTKLPKNPDPWLEGATQHPGSWWSDWDPWLARRAGRKARPASRARASSNRSRMRPAAMSRYARANTVRQAAGRCAAAADWSRWCFRERYRGLSPSRYHAALTLTERLARS